MENSSPLIALEQRYQFQSMPAKAAEPTLPLILTSFAPLSVLRSLLTRRRGERTILRRVISPASSYEGTPRSRRHGGAGRSGASPATNELDIWPIRRIFSRCPIAMLCSCGARGHTLGGSERDEEYRRWWC